jgi:predicted ATPase/DNA-binding CsgD family transcriptional regulator
MSGSIHLNVSTFITIQAQAYKVTLPPGGLKGGFRGGVGFALYDRRMEISRKGIEMASESNSNSGDLPVERLTHRELEVLKLYAAGFSNPELADHLTLARSTVKWYAQQIYSKLGVHSRQQALERARTLGLLEPEHASASLPKAATRFVGRLDELRDVTQRLQNPDCRFLTLTGPSGIGKTRLALQVAQELISQRPGFLPQGVFFVPLENCTTPGDLDGFLAQALQIEFLEHGERAREQLLGYLRHKRLLLLLDNFEHLAGPESAAFINELLTNAPGLKLLVTSTVRLNLPGEHVFPLEGLELPPAELESSAGLSVQEARAFGSLQLFERTAQRVRPAFTLNETNLKPVIQLCQITDGMPLGIELAAGWVEVLSPQALLEEVSSSLDFLQTHMHGVPERQRSLRAVFDASWRMLEEGERQAVMKLAIFQGGFTPTAARQVTGIPPQVLLALSNKSWIKKQAERRFQFHPLMKKFIQALAETTDSWENLRAHHSDYFCTFADRYGRMLPTGQYHHALETLRPELDNLRAAWQWALEQGHWQSLQLALVGLCTYFLRSGRYREGAELCSQAAQRLEQAKADDQTCLLAHLYVWQAAFTSDAQESAGFLAKSQNLLDRLDLTESCQQVQALAWRWQGQQAAWSDRQKGITYFRKSLALYRQLGDEPTAAQVMTDLGWAMWITGQIESAQNYLEDSRRIHSQTGNFYYTARTLTLLGLLAHRAGRNTEAERLHRESLVIARSIDSAPGIADSLYVLAYSLTYSGEFDEAAALAEESRLKYTGMGYEGAYLAKPYAAQAFADLGRGDYPRSRMAAEQSLQLAIRYNNRQDLGTSLLTLGKLALIEKQIKAAGQYFAESYQALQVLQHPNAVLVLAYQSIPHLARGERPQARDKLFQATNQAIENRGWPHANEILQLAGFWLSQEGRWQQALTLFTLTQQFAYVSASRFFTDLFGPARAQAQAELTPAERADAEARARSLDVWQALEEVAETLAESAGNPP